MAIPNSKEELQTAIKTSFDKLLKEVAEIPEELVTIEELEGHSKGSLMSINDLLAYLIGWGELVLKWVERKEMDLPVDFPETGFKWNELGKLAQKFYQDYKDDTFDQRLTTLQQTVDQILEYIQTKSNEELYETCWYGKWPLGRMIQFNTSSPFVNARGRIRKWKKVRA